MKTDRIHTKWVVLFCVIVMGVNGGSAFAQGRNDNATFLFDYQTTSADTQTTSTIDDTPSPVFYEDADGNIFFDATVVLRGAVDLVGVNCDVVFEADKLQVVSIHEARGDLNFDGRSNIADILVLGEMFNQLTNEDGYSYFDRAQSEGSEGQVDYQDIEAVLPFINENNIFWTANPNLDFTALRESVEIFESPEVSNTRGKIEDLVVVLLSRIHPIPDDFGFNGDARIADITFQVIGDISAGTTIRFEDRMAIDEGTVITSTEITNASVPAAKDEVITRP